MRSRVSGPTGVTIAALAIVALLGASATTAYGAPADDLDALSSEALLTEAADGYIPGRAATAVELVDVAAEYAAPIGRDSVGITSLGSGESLAIGAHSALFVSENGAVSVASPDGLELGLAHADEMPSEVVDG